MAHHLVTRYEFTAGRLSGYSLGGAVQSQDKPGIGYRFLKDANRRHAAVLAILYSDPAELQVAVLAGDRRLSATDDLHPQGRPDAAERGYRGILLRQTDQVHALQLLGVIAYQRGDNAVALRLMSYAIAAMPTFAACHNELGLGAAQTF